MEKAIEAMITFEEVARRYPMLWAMLDEFGGRGRERLANMLEATDHYQVNRCRNALAEILDLYSGDPGCNAARPREIHGVHFVWRRIATLGTGNGGWFVPTRAHTQLGRELNALSRALIGLLLPNFDVGTLLGAGGLFFEGELAAWIGSEHTTPENVLQMAGYIAVCCQGRAFGRRDIKALQTMGFVPVLDYSSCPRIETAILTAARAVIVKRAKQARSQS